MACEGCDKRRGRIRYFFFRIKQRIQRRLRIISGSQAVLQYQGKAINEMMQAGALLEQRMIFLDKASEAWLEDLTKRQDLLLARIEELEGQVRVLTPPELSRK